MRRAKNWGVAILLFLVSLSAGSITSWVQGDLGDARKVVTSVISKYLAQSTGPEVKASLKALGPEKKSALVNFMGAEGKGFLLSQCAPEVCAVIKPLKPAGRISEDDFRKIYPDILSSILGRMPADKYGKFILSTGNEIAAEALFMGWQGQNKYFAGLDPSRHEIILKTTPTWMFLEMGLRRYAEIKDYTCILYKQERLGRKLQDVETILVKYRDKPKSIYMKWLAGPWKGRELLYNEALSKTDVRVRESGFLGVIPIWIDYHNPIAQRGTNHPAIEIGLKFLLELNLDQYKKATPKNELGRADHGIREFEGRKVYVMENILPREKNKGYYCYRVVHYMDYLNAIEPKVEVFNWDNKLYESYLYTKLKLNTGLTEKDFDPENPEYRL